jgi:hypothetical protein
MELERYTRAADLGFSMVNSRLAILYYQGGDLNKAKFHYKPRLSKMHLGGLEADLEIRNKL